MSVADPHSNDMEVRVRERARRLWRQAGKPQGGVEAYLEEARELMRSRRIRHLPILDAEGEVVGVVSIGDLNAHLTTHHEVTIHYLEEYLHGRV